MPEEKLFRLTRQRRVILEELKKERRHPTAEEVYERVRSRLPHVSLATVYRTLELLADQGFLLRLESGAGPRQYDLNRQPHAHIRCEVCSRLDDIGARVQLSVKDSRGYEVHGYTLEFQGVCPGCCKKREKRKEPRRQRNRPG